MENKKWSKPPTRIYIYMLDLMARDFKLTTTVVVLSCRGSSMPGLEKLSMGIIAGRSKRWSVVGLLSLVHHHIWLVNPVMTGQELSKPWLRGEQTILRCLFWRCGSRKEMPPPGIQTWKFDIWRFITGKIIYKWWIFQQASKPCLITGEYNVLQRFRFASWSDIKGGLKQLSKIVNTLKESHMCHTVRFEASHLDLRNEEAQLHQENMFFNAKMSQNSSRSQRTKVQVSTSPW